MESPNYKIQVSGYNNSVRAIERLAPDLKKALDKEVRGILSTIVNQARDHIPYDVHPSGWMRENKLQGQQIQTRRRISFRRLKSIMEFYLLQKVLVKIKVAH